MIVIKILNLIGIIGVVAIWIFMLYRLIFPSKQEENYDLFKRYINIHRNIDIALYNKIETLTLNEIIEGIKEEIESCKEQMIILDELKGYVEPVLEIKMSELPKFLISIEILRSLYKDSFKTSRRLLECKDILEDMNQNNLKEENNN